jgi:hypothetical protein
MALTTTTVITNASLVTATNKSNVTKLTLQAATSLVIVEARLTSTTQIERSRLINVKFAVSAYDVSAAAGAVSHVRDAVTLDVIPLMAAGVSVCTSEGDLNKGGFMYLWLEHSAMPTGTTLTVVVTEQ